MRTVLRDAVAGQIPEHLGLAYSNRWAPLGDRDGKVPDDVRARWLQRLCELPLSPDYAGAYQRWRRSLERDRSRAVEVELAGRLLVGHGDDSPTEVGLTVQHTWGAPLLPGRALKGLLNHYVDAVYGPDAKDVDPRDAALNEEQRERARYRGVTYQGRRILYGPGDIHRGLFGAPAVPGTDAGDGEEGSGGAVIFHDGWYIPSGPAGAPGDRPFAPDVLTVHHKDYYNQAGRAGGPNDYDPPNPVAFLTVRPGARFLLSLSGPPPWTALAFELLREALCEWGVGGKTAAGYGRVARASWKPVLGDGGEARGAPDGAGQARPPAASLREP